MTPQDKPHRFFVPDLAVAWSQADRPPRIRLPADEAHHAVRVLRLRPGAPVELFDGRGRSAVGSIAEVSRRLVAVQIDRSGPETPRAEPIVHLAFAVPKGNRADWLVEKATELGAASLRPTIFQRSVAAKEGLSPARRDRWRARCVAAAKQSGQSLLPTVEDTGSLEEVLARACGSLVLVGDVTESAEPLAQALARRYAGQPVLLVVGPEGGLTDGERGSLRAAGATWVRLGRSVLRIETAAVALLAAVLAVSETAIPSTDNHRSH